MEEQRMRHDELRFAHLAIKTVIVHTVTYSVMGVLALFVLDYATLYARPDMAGFMRQTTDRMVMAGPLVQPIRGLVFALVIFPLRELLLARKHGWLLLWWILVALGIIATFGPAPGSIEGLVYTRISVPHQLLGLLEVVLQALLLASGVVYWVNHPEKRWLTWLLIVAFVLAMALPLAGLLATSRGA
jgi:hypothetical protein